MLKANSRTSDTRVWRSITLLLLICGSITSVQAVFACTGWAPGEYSYYTANPYVAENREYFSRLARRSSFPDRAAYLNQLLRKRGWVTAKGLIEFRHPAIISVGEHAQYVLRFKKNSNKDGALKFITETKVKDRYVYDEIASYTKAAGSDEYGIRFKLARDTFMFVIFLPKQGGKALVSAAARTKVYHGCGYTLYVATEKEAQELNRKTCSSIPPQYRDINKIQCQRYWNAGKSAK